MSPHAAPGAAGTNWAGNFTYSAHTLHRPATIEQLQETVARASKIRVLGSRHSFSDIGDAAELVTLAGLPTAVVVDHTARTVSLTAGVTYSELATVLGDEGLALANLASLPHISVAGAVATASHGSGDRNGNLATAVAALTMVTSDGELMTASRLDADFAGLVVGLGACGAVTAITLDVEPAYEVRQRVYEEMTWESLFEGFDAITGSGYSVSAFTLWGPVVHQVWVKDRVGSASEAVHDTVFGAVAATVDRHPLTGLDAVNCTPQMGVPGPWSERLPHFRSGFTPSSGEEIQSEYLVPRRDAVAAIEAVRALSDTLRPLVLVSEIRTVAADKLWMSPQYAQDTVGIHFTWRRQPEAVARALVAIEAALRPFAARPHWGKVFLAEADAIRPLYPRLDDFASLVAQIDARGAFRNEWLERRVLGRH